MAFESELPIWQKLGTKPPANILNTEGWGAGKKPPADWFDWLFNRNYLALQELQRNSIHSEQKGANNGIASLGADGKLLESQRPPTQTINDGTTSTKGIVQLEDSVTSTSTTKAATPNSVKSAWDLANGKYSKPASGIPKTDLDTSVKTSLNNADSALQSVPDATTSTKGIVQLNNSTTSTLTTQAATANAVKIAMDRANEAFTSASNGKTSIANATGAPSTSSDTFTKIAGDITNGKASIAAAIRGKGGTASDMASMTELANATNSIPLGKKYASGTITSAATQMYISNESGVTQSTSYVPFNMANLPFTPSFVEFTRTDKFQLTTSVWHRNNHYVSGSQYANSYYGANIFRVPYAKAVINIPVNNSNVAYDWMAYE